jgi:hypothetical protein
MNEGGIASLMSNGGSEAMMLELESAPNWAQKVHTNIVGGEWDDERDLLEDFTLAIPRAADAAVDPVLDFMDAYDELKDETEAVAESMLERAKELGVDSSEEAQQIMEEETEGRGFGSLSPELTEMIGEILMPGAGMVKMGKGVTKVGEKGLRELRKMLNMGKHSPKGDPRPPILGTERSKPPEIPKYIPEKDATTHLKQAISKTKKPPKMWYGGAPLYKKGYYGKSYK